MVLNVKPERALISMTYFASFLGVEARTFSERKEEVPVVFALISNTNLHYCIIPVRNSRSQEAHTELRLFGLNIRLVESQTP